MPMIERKRLSLQDKEKIYQLYQAGITVEALSADYDVTVSTIKNYIRYFRRKERNEQWCREQREKEAERSCKIGTLETPLINTAEYLYSLVQRLPDCVKVEVLKDSSRIAVSITGAGEDIILANSKGGFCEAGKAD